MLIFGGIPTAQPSPSIAPPSRANSQHRAAIGCKFEALRCHQVLILKIALPLGANLDPIQQLVCDILMRPDRLD
jgi:hypothetical protein